MKKILVLFALMFMSAPTYAAIEEDLAWMYTCIALTVLYPQVNNCETITVPAIIYTQGLLRGAKGLYVHGEPQVLVRANIKDSLRTVIHELTHYVMYESGIAKDMNTCQKEKIVRLIAGQPWNASIKAKYGCLTLSMGK